MANCNVCIAGYDGDAAAFYDARMVRARKMHRCYDCGNEIAVGAMYERISGKWDQEVSSYTICALCSEIGEAFSCDGSRTFGNLWETIEEFFDEFTTGCLDKLTTAAAKQKVMDRWQRWKKLA